MILTFANFNWMNIIQWFFIYLYNANVNLFITIIIYNITYIFSLKIGEK